MGEGAVVLHVGRLTLPCVPSLRTSGAMILSAHGNSIPTTVRGVTREEVRPGVMAGPTVKLGGSRGLLVNTMAKVVVAISKVVVNISKLVEVPIHKMVGETITKLVVVEGATSK